MVELKPCPFCGGKAKICATTTKTYPKNHGQHWCYCERCGATGQSFSDFEDDGSSVFKAIEAWNRRDDNESEFSKELNSIPAADVVEVVRCRDCKHRPVVTDESHAYGFGLACPKEGAYQDVTCPYLCDDGYYNRMPADGWYCAHGERRADNGK